MSDKHEAVNIFPSHVEAEAAVLELQKAGFDMQKISIIGDEQIELIDAMGERVQTF